MGCTSSVPKPRGRGSVSSPTSQPSPALSDLPPPVTTGTRPSISKRAAFRDLLASEGTSLCLKASHDEPSVDGPVANAITTDSIEPIICAELAPLSSPGPALSLGLVASQTPTTRLVGLTRITSDGIVLDPSVASNPDIVEQALRRRTLIRTPVKLHACIGGGTFGKVFHCTDSGGRHLAVKTMSSAANGQALSALFDEVAVSLFLSGCVGSVPVYDVIVVSDRVLIIQPLFDCGDLDSVIATASAAGAIVPTNVRHASCRTGVHAASTAPTAALWGGAGTPPVRLSTHPSPVPACDFSQSFSRITTGALRRGLVPEAVLKGIVWQALQGLHTMHRFGSAHRDIKPSNILLSRDGAVAIADFGCSALKTRTLRTFTGTLAYMAPERVQPNPSYGLPSDIWSLGLVTAKGANGELELEQMSSPIDACFAVLQYSFAPLRTESWSEDSAAGRGRLSQRASAFSLSGESGVSMARPDGHWRPDAFPSALKDFVDVCTCPAPERATTADLLRHPWLRGMNGPRARAVVRTYFCHRGSPGFQPRCSFEGCSGEHRPLDVAAAASPVSMQRLSEEVFAASGDSGGSCAAVVPGDSAGRTSATARRTFVLIQPRRLATAEPVPWGAGDGGEDTAMSEGAVEPTVASGSVGLSVRAMALDIET
eukprot:TRINITY_DN726_c0_g3_i1.p1 TRINITY_DN726_c0_g3~~TRINITY_DN726_c0_g3_i1.p1  ORF type:complete len:655 (+),score=74.86 TRINITY_DN726_c0_g3_i1:122-2086(+)